MGDKYTLPSGLATCEYYNEFTGASSINMPSSAKNRNKALIEAMQQLHKMQRKINDLERQLNARI
jgi:hypothetical protein